jgi:hypothetical protein
MVSLYGCHAIVLWYNVYGIDSILVCQPLRSRVYPVQRDRESMPSITKPEVQGRTLIHFPIIHSQMDMGGFSETVREVTLGKLGLGEWKRKINLVKQFWTDIEQAIRGLDLPLKRIRLYQDGLPVCGREIEIVTELAEKGGPNHILLQHLMKKGAMLMGTESPALLIEEYRLMKEILASGNVQETIRLEAMHKKACDALLEKRDAYIADRIAATLKAGETGLLFLGILHRIEGRLPKDIHLLYPLKRPVDKRGT